MADPRDLTLFDLLGTAGLPADDSAEAMEQVLANLRLAGGFVRHHAARLAWMTPDELTEWGQRVFDMGAP